MNLSFENKVLLVTGAASGMGLAGANAFAEASAAVVRASATFRELEEISTNKTTLWQE